MTLTRRQRIIRYGAAILLLFVFFVLPAVLGIFLRGTVESKVQAALGAPATLGRLSVHLFPPGATLSNLDIGETNSAAGNQPLAKISSLRASVSLGTVFGGNTHLSSVSIDGATLNVSVNEKGRSTLSQFLAKIPDDGQKKPELPIDSLTLKNVRLNTHLAPKLRAPGLPAGPDSTLELDYLKLANYIVPPKGELLGREIWSRVDIAGVRCTAPAFDGAVDSSGGVADGLSVRRVSFEMAQAPNTAAPVKFRGLSVDSPEIATVFTKPGRQPAVARALQALELATAEIENKEKKAPEPTGCGLLIEGLKVTGGRIETRGPDASDKLAFWRLDDLNVEGANIAVGPKVSAAGPGHLTAESVSESSSGPGGLKLSCKNLAGGYPESSFEFDYKLDGAAAAAFSVRSEEKARARIKSGTVAMELAGPVTEGKLKLDGSITLSTDFEIAPAIGIPIPGAMSKNITRAATGQPLKPLAIRGTLSEPTIDWPTQLKAMGVVFEGMFLGGSTGLTDLAGAMLSTTTSLGIEEIKSASELLKKIPGADRLPSLDNVPFVKDLFK